MSLLRVGPLGVRVGRVVAVVAVLLAFGARASAAERKRAEAKPAPAEATADEAQDDEKPDPDKPKPEIGPKQIDLGDDLVLDLPADMGYFNRADAKKLMEKMGNPPDDSLRGLVFKRDADWLISIEYTGEGYVKDDDAAELKPDEILSSIKEGTEEANKYRKEKGVPPIHADSWSEPPRYDRALHHLVWGIRGKDDDGTISTINFYTRALGRRGYVALNLMDDPKTIEASKVDGLAVLRATTFKPGSRYEDFDKSKDKVAEYGLAALVLGGAGAAALKLGLGGKLLALIIAGKKVIVLFFVAIGAWFKKLFGHRRRQPEPPAAGPPPTDPPAGTP
jgi:uncharacterized membrane-anchored protein